MIAAGRARRRDRAWCAGAWVLVAAVSLVLVGGGCATPPRVLTAEEQHVIDRRFVEYPANYELRRYASGFTAPTAIAFDSADGSMLVAEGERGDEPTIWRVSLGAAKVSQIYPKPQTLPFKFPNSGWHMYGPIGGMVVAEGRIIVTHRDEHDLGVVTSLDRQGGNPKTLVAGLPAQGDYGLTDIAIHPVTGAVWFGCGSATNSGVVGLDNWQIGWVRKHPEVRDVAWHDMELLGYKFQTVNPIAGVFGPSETAVTAPLQPFAQSSAIRVNGSPDGKPSGAIYAVPRNGGFAEVMAHGIHNPRGIAFNEYGQPYFTNDGMEMRGTRPIKNDPDALLRLPPGREWFGFPDYTADLRSVSDPRFQPPEWMISKSGYPQVRPLIDVRASAGLTPPIRETLLEAAFPSLSGANKMTFAPDRGAFKEFQGSVIVCLSGDRTPFASGGVALPRPVGFKVVRVDLDKHSVSDFVRNVGDLPASRIGGGSKHPDYVERPIDAKFGPDGALYILDAGRMSIPHAQENYEPETGKIYRLVPVRSAPTTTTTQGAQ